MSETPDSPTSEPRVLGGRYEIHRPLAKGGMADVFLARDSALDRPVAVKVLFSDFARDQAFVERFRREAQSAANLTHPNIVGVYDWGAENDTYYIVMEFVDGQSLAQILGVNGPINPRRVAEIGFDVAGALGTAHRNGVVHRDVKPGNVLVTSAGVPKVTDFGIARALSAPNEDLTEAGSVMGTATYFSPEQAQGFPVDARSDLYSLGVVMYEVLCGRPPFVGDTTVAVAYKHVQERPPLPSEFVAGIPEGLEAIVMRLLSKNPDNRYLSSDDLRADLRLWLDGEVPRALSGGAIGAAAGGLAAGAAIDPNATVVNAPVGAATPINDQPTEFGTPAVASMVSDVEPEEDDDDEDGEGKKNALFWSLVAVMLLLLGGLGFWLYQSLPDDSAVETVTVPRVVDRDENDARDILEAAGFNPITKTETSADTPEGVVIRQDPGPDSEAPEGSDVTIYVSLGRQTADLIDFRGKNADAAQKDLETFGFKPIQERESNSELAEGLVIRTDPPAGSTVDVGSKVILYVSSGADAVDIPNVAGLSESDARAQLEAANFVLGDNILQNSSTIAEGEVIGTDPSGQASTGSTVSLIISSGQGTVAVPAVRGRTESDAAAAMTAVGLRNTVTFSNLPPGDPNIGRVLSTDPGAGTEVSVGTSVDLIIGAAGSTTTVQQTTTTTTTSP